MAPHKTPSHQSSPDGNSVGGGFAFPDMAGEAVGFIGKTWDSWGAVRFMVHLNSENNAFFTFHQLIPFFLLFSKISDFHFSQLCFFYWFFTFFQIFLDF